MTSADVFPFVQFEFGFLLGPGDGRYLVRDSAEEPVRRVLVLATLGAPERRSLLRGRSGKELTEAEPEPVPTARATLVRAEPLASEAEAERWLEGLREDPEAADAEVESAARELNGVLRAYRLAAADPHGPSASPARALVWRIGYGDGDRVSDGRYAAAWEPPRERAAHGRKARRMAAPDERFAALVGGREHSLACEELILRARTDLDGGRPREAALQARIGLECLLAELADEPGAGIAKRRSELAEHRAAIGEAANAALAGDPGEPLQETVAEVVSRMEAALRHRAHGLD